MFRIKNTSKIKLWFLCYALISVLIFPVNKIFPQTNNEGWFWQYPKPQGNTLRDIFIFDSSKAIAVGDLGTIIKTYDGGKSWDVHHHAGGTDIDLYSVHFTDTLNGWSCGGIWYEGKNVLIRTFDGGKTWEIVNNITTGDTSYTYSAVYFVNADTGFVIGEDGIVLRTTDGGNIWDKRKMDDYIGLYLDLFKLLAITFTDNKTGWIVGEGYYGNVIFKTTDCGKTWQWNERIILPKFFGKINDIFFVNKNNGFIIGDLGFFAKTTNGGITWLSQNLSEIYKRDEYQYFYSVCFTDPFNGWIIGGDYYAFILKTTDGGENWVEVVNTNSEMMHQFYKIRFADRNNGWIVGQFGMIYRTIDSGENWISQREKQFYFRSIYFVDENNGWAVGDSGVILHTNNGGENWIKQNQIDSLLFSSVYAIDKQNIFSVGSIIKGSSIFDRNGIILKSTNGGQSWERQTFDTLYGFNSIVFVNDSIGWISGTEVLLKTTDQGNNWVKVLSNIPYGKIQFINENVGWIGGILRTTDGGKNWKNQTIPELSFPQTYFVNADLGWIVGDNNGGNNIYKTNDGGESWIPSGNTYPGYYFSICFVNETTGWIAGYNYSNEKSIIKTTNGGNTWFGQNIPSKMLTDFFFLNDKVGWVIGDGIFKTMKGGGIVSIKDNKELNKNIHEKIELYQNYPNPFNPSTTIAYKLNKSEKVRLIIFNILGQEVEILVDEEQNSGVHKINWNSKNISSGIYFYQLTTITGVLTKKMLLIR